MPGQRRATRTTHDHFALFAADLLNEEQQELVDAAAESLYGLIHARYIITTKGLNAMVRALVAHLLPPPRPQLTRARAQTAV